MKFKNYKSFSLIEIIFAIIIIAILASFSFSNLTSSLNKAGIMKLKSDYAIIQSALNKYQNKTIYQNANFTLNTLDDDNRYLFNKILSQPFIASDKLYSWQKISSNQYNYKLSSTQNLIFTYDKTNFTFLCDKTETLCQEILK